jgi:hypothetical protein
MLVVLLERLGSSVQYEATLGALKIITQKQRRKKERLRSMKSSGGPAVALAETAAPRILMLAGADKTMRCLVSIMHPAHLLGFQI